MAKILIVEDDPDFVEITRTILQSQGHEVAAASEGKAALQAMHQNKPDLVLLDVIMSTPAPMPAFFQQTSTYLLTPGSPNP